MTRDQINDAVDAAMKGMTLADQFDFAAAAVRYIQVCIHDGVHGPIGTAATSALAACSVAERAFRDAENDTAGYGRPLYKTGQGEYEVRHGG